MPGNNKYVNWRLGVYVSEGEHKLVFIYYVCFDLLFDNFIKNSLFLWHSNF